MKEFERPQIIDTFESPEGVYLASGSTHEDPPPKDTPRITYYYDINSHDGGSHSDCSFIISSSKGSYDFVIEAHLNNPSLSITKAWVNSWAGPASDAKAKATNYGFYFETHISHNNTFDSCQFSIGIIFKDTGAYMGKQGTVPTPEQEAREVFTFYPNL